MAFGLTGAPNTFFDAMNNTLSLVLRKCALLVFFDDILVYSTTTLDQHIIHLESVLQLLRRDQWKVNLSKCAFAQTTIAYLGHIINGQGVATDPTKIQVGCSNGQHQRMPKSSKVSSVWPDSIGSSLGILASYPDLSHTC